ncbi:MAG: NAD(P)/FAD-dependent oxidoreductase [Candidatus Marinimicrobia bacterium]|nr:NAD(P)/FAD-dependent oxidoreductase [Candidatus Neomarinimicrobiota bacterium]MCF7840760.1 NAD(P)/FAD-dependent oxidoreductase [Candidatus Neomarinimicrobiota bacterium]MCF7902692.1 NAD(P)/FAD-dependent oxidoreductase [Candidatus Neomarinimicrobiota bacterium]
MSTQRTDVLIVGGGPAGAACAGVLKQNGVDCLVLDKAPFPRSKPCAGWITPEMFRELNLSPTDYPHGLTTFRSFRIAFPRAKFKLPVRQYAIRRYEFDEWLLRRSGVSVVNHEVKTIVARSGGYEIDGKFWGNYLVGAGGTHCPVYRTFFHSDSPRAADALIIAQEDEFPYQTTDQQCRLWFFENDLPGYAWFVPKTDGYVNFGIGGLAGSLRQKGETLKPHWDLLQQQLEEAGLLRHYTRRPVGHYYYRRTRPQNVRYENAFLAGDAASLATYDMGEGIRAAIMSGQRVAQAIVQESDYDLTTIPKYSLPSLVKSGVKSLVSLS